MRIGLIGRGTIGTFLLEKINQEQKITNAQVIGILDERKEAKDALMNDTKEYDVQGYTSIEEFLKAPIDLVVECANVSAAKTYAPIVLEKKDLFLISVGALADQALLDTLEKITKKKDRTLYLPSGAIGGLDVLQSANVLDGLTSVTLETKKPAEALTEKKLEKALTVFSGSAKEAIQNYPENINVSIIVSFAGIGMEQTKVKIIADPHTKTNTHQLYAEGDFGTFNLTLENHPSPMNPKTSYLTSLSLLSSLKALGKSIVLG